MMDNCNHSVLIVDSFHSTGTFTTCIECKGSMFLSSSEADRRVPFIYTSGEGADYDKCVLIHRRDL